MPPKGRKYSAILILFFAVFSCTTRIDHLLESDNYDAVMEYAKGLVSKGLSDRNLANLEKLLDHAQKLRPQDAEALDTAGNLLLDLVHNTNDIKRQNLETIVVQARSYFEQALTFDPKNTCHYGYIAICDSTLGDHSAAAEILARALRLEPDNQNLLVDYGVALWKASFPEEAEKILRTVVESSQADHYSMNYVRANEHLSRLYLNRGDIARAEQFLDHSIQALARRKNEGGAGESETGAGDSKTGSMQTPTNICPYNNMGLTYLTDKQQEQSTSRLQQEITAAKEQQRRKYVELTKQYLTHDDASGAARVLRKALAEYPDDAELIRLQTRLAKSAPDGR